MVHKVSFKHAIDGLIYTFKTQPNMRFHLTAAVAVLFASFFFGLTYLEFLAVTVAICLVFVAEMVNTSIESMTDLITTEYRQQAKIAKDVSAGMVLTAAICSVVIAVLVFTPHLIDLLT